MPARTLAAVDTSPLLDERARSLITKQQSRVQIEQKESRGRTTYCKKKNKNLLDSIQATALIIVVLVFMLLLSALR